MRLIFLIPIILWSCSVEDNSSLNSLIPYNNRPEILSNLSFERHFDQLPLLGDIGRKLWTDHHYWPYDQGGTARDFFGYTSPLGLFDLVYRDKNQAVEWELNEAKRLKDRYWAGHCDGLAAASIREPAPVSPVLYKGVHFPVYAIRALLMEIWEGAGQKVVGQRCRKWDRPESLACTDLNPAAFHIALANLVGRYHESFIIDTDPGNEVWNFAIEYFSSTSRELSRSGLDAIVLPTQVKENLLKYDNRTILHIETQVITTGGPSQYEYLLELGPERKIIGGMWLGKSRSNHPDFMWVPSISPQPDNPYVDVDVVRLINQMSQNNGEEE